MKYTEATQHSETVMVWNYQNADCSFKNTFIVSFTMIFGTLSFPIVPCVCVSMCVFWR